MEISRRDYFAIHANVDWIKNANTKGASVRTGIPKPDNQATEEEVIEFWVKVEVTWRWKFADSMLRGE